MKQFKFSLEQILMLKQNQEKQISMGLAEIQQTLHVLEMDFRKTTELYQQTTDELKGAYQNLSFIENILSLQASLKELDSMIQAQAKNISQYRERKKDISLKLTQAVKERRLLDKLHGKQRVKYILESRHLEGKQLDEIATNTVARQRLSRETTLCGNGF